MWRIGLQTMGLLCRARRRDTCEPWLASATESATDELVVHACRKGQGISMYLGLCLHEDGVLRFQLLLVVQQAVC